MTAENNVRISQESGHTNAFPKGAILELRRMKEPFRTALLSDLATAFDLKEMNDLPPYFLAEVVHPAQIGIAKELETLFGTANSPAVSDERRKCLNIWFGTFQYHQSIIQEARRFDLWLRPVGEIDERAYRYAMMRLSKRKAKRQSSNNTPSNSPSM